MKLKVIATVRRCFDESFHIRRMVFTDEDLKNWAQEQTYDTDINYHIVKDVEVESYEP